VPDGDGGALSAVADPLLRERLAAVPDYDRFATVDELVARTARLADDHPDRTRLRRIGTSRLGEPLHCLEIGGGERHAVVFGFPHPNEPIGGLTALHLAETLCADDRLRDGLGLTWHVVPCIDPDGTRLNEGWFGGPFTRATYARNYYRPAGFEQIEWTFPFAYKSAWFDRVLPETLALMRLIDETAPALLCALHNAETSGIYYYLSRPVQELHQVLHEIPAALGLPLDLGEPEVPYAPLHAPAIFGTIRMEDAYDFIERAGGDPASALAGESSAAYAERHGTLYLVCEAPYWLDGRVADESEVEVGYGELLRAHADALDEFVATARAALDAVAGDLVTDSPFRRASSAFVRDYATLPAQHRHRAADAASARPATVAERYSLAQALHMARLGTSGMLVRALDGELGVGNGTPAIRETRGSFGERFDAWLAEAERDTPPPVPIRKLVAVQLGAILAAAARV